MQRDAIGTPANGLLIYQTDVAASFYYFDGTTWLPFGGGADNDWTLSGANMYNANTGNVGVGTAAPTAKLHVEDAGTPSTLLNEDFESGSISFTTGGDANWIIETTNVNGGANAARSGVIGNNQSSFMEYTVTVPAQGATLNFFISTGTEANFDLFNFYINGMDKGEWSGVVPYTQQTYNLLAGTNTLRWEYVKDSGSRVLPDAAYVDDITINASAPPAFRLVDGNQSDGFALISDANGNATWQQLTSNSLGNFPQLITAQGLEIPICDSNLVTATNSFVINIKGVPTTVTWTILDRQSSAGTVVNISGSDVLAAPYNPERLQVRYDFSPFLPFEPQGLIFSANNNSSFPDTFSLNYALKSAASITMNITRTDIYGDQSSNCWTGQFFFDMLITD